MNTYNNIYRALGNEYLKNIIADVIQASTALDIDFFGVGALARNIWYIENDLTARGTKDVDFGVYIPDAATYQQLKVKLIQGFGYVQATENVFCLISPQQIPVDFLPFGEIENQGKVIIAGKGLSTIRLDGFQEVYDYGIRSVNLGLQTINVCTIPAVVLLKLIAFDDRPDYRYKDAADIASIITEFPQIESDLLWENYSYLYDSEYSHEEIGTIVLGSEVGKLIYNNHRLIQRVFTILDDSIQLNNQLAARMILDSLNETVVQKVKQLKLIKMGLNNMLS